METVRRHKTQKKLKTQLIWTKSINNLNWVKWFKQSNKQKRWYQKNWTNWLLCHGITLFLAVSHQRSFFACLQLITLILAVSPLIQRLGDFCGQVLLLSAFRHRKHVLVCLQLIGLDLVKSSVFLFLLLSYAVFSFMTPKICLSLFVAKLTLFIVRSY